MSSHDEIFRNIQKPITYLNGEVNSFHCQTKKHKIKLAIGYPDFYEVGMSNLGIRILYHILNNIQDVVCERFFAPGSDLEDVLRKTNIPLFTIESRTPLKHFDIIGFSLSCELNYTNLLNLLSLSHIPLHCYERSDNDPIILGGGNCSFNPEALSDFVDLWVVGEGEEVIVKIIEVYK
ncbi:MAG TPA: B12-binding domain-containing radical SAM protein, partial [bacterium]|nr:B12-binding domain-containing radical SAM protein [bacterium]